MAKSDSRLKQAVKVKNILEELKRSGVILRTHLEKKAANHILVTGPSGSGKSTHAAKLSKELNLPVISLDKSKHWLAAEEKYKDTLLKDSLGARKYNALRSKAVKEALASKQRSIIEGTQVYGLPLKEVKKHELHLVNLSREKVVSQRIGRDRGKGKEITQTRYDIAGQLYDETIQRHKQLAKLPETILVGDKKGMSKTAAKVLAHIAGPSGSGKTTIVNVINKKYKNIVAKDLDDFDDEAERQLGWDNIRKKQYTGKMLKTLYHKRQELMDNFIDQSKKPIVFAGHHLEAKRVLKIPTTNKYRLDVSAKESAYRGYKRSLTEDPKYRRYKEDLPSDIRAANEDIDFLTKNKYKPFSHKEILKKLGAAQHILVTGPSGSGKTTFATELSERENLPIVSLDDNPRWKRAFQKYKSDFHEIGMGRSKYNALRRNMLKDALKNSERSVIEGSQILGAPKIASKYQSYLVDTPKELTIRSRMARRKIRRDNVGKSPRDVAKEFASANNLYSEAERYIPGFKRTAKPEVIKRNYLTDKELKESTLKRIAYEKRKGMSPNAN